MRIAAVIARAKKSVQAGGLPGVVVELGETLRSDAIPAPLRQAAARIADLLRVPEPVERNVVPLVRTQPEQTIEAPVHGVHGAMNDRGAGVCPFTGVNAQGESVAAPAAAPVSAGTVSEQLAHSELAPPSPLARPRARFDEADDSAREQNLESPVLQVAAPAPELAVARGATERDPPVEPAAVKPAARKPEAKTRSVPPVSARAPEGALRPAPAPSAGKGQAQGAKKKTSKVEKSHGELAAKPSPAKTSARPSKGPTGKQSGSNKQHKKK